MLPGRYAVAYDPLRSERRIELIVLLLGLLVCLLLFYGVLRLALVSAPSVVVPAEDSLLVTNVMTQGNVASGDSEEIRARPLFWSSRRPFVAPPSVKPKPKKEVTKVAELKGVKLLGVFGTGDTVGIIALVKGKKARILQGEAVEGWTLESVSSNEVVFSGSGRSQTLVLQARSVIAPAVPAVPAAPAKGAGATSVPDDELTAGGGLRGG
jgi:hypothetical protein